MFLRCQFAYNPLKRWYTMPWCSQKYDRQPDALRNSASTTIRGNAGVSYRMYPYVSAILYSNPVESMRLVSHSINDRMHEDNSVV